MSVVLIDTSVFCNIVPVPGRDQNRHAMLTRLQELVVAKTTLLLPMAAVLETGNHIAQMSGGGSRRRRTAGHFCKLVTDAIDGTAPWVPTPFWELEILRGWLGEFPGHAMANRGMGDFSIIKEWERQCSLHRARRVLIWSLDQHLNSFDREP